MNENILFIRYKSNYSKTLVFTNLRVSNNLKALEVFNENENSVKVLRISKIYKILVFGKCFNFIKREFDISLQDIFLLKRISDIVLLKVCPALNRMNELFYKRFEGKMKVEGIIL